jgi:hypothetical protein
VVVLDLKKLHIEYINEIVNFFYIPMACVLHYALLMSGVFSVACILNYVITSKYINYI